MHTPYVYQFMIKFGNVCELMNNLENIQISFVSIFFMVFLFAENK